jgi:hypothetical protein
MEVAISKARKHFNGTIQLDFTLYQTKNSMIERIWWPICPFLRARRNKNQKEITNIG